MVAAKRKQRPNPSVTRLESEVARLRVKNRRLIQAQAAFRAHLDRAWAALAMAQSCLDLARNEAESMDSDWE